MSDDVLRELERILEREESVRARVDLAKALERVGRNDDAVDVLLPARQDPEIRPILDRLRPIGMTAVRPLRECPSRLWERSVEGEIWQDGKYASPSYVFATPLILVVQRGVGDLYGIDPDSGGELWRAPTTERLCPLGGALARLGPGTAVGFVDLATGTTTESCSLEGSLICGIETDTATVLTRDEDWSLRAFRIQRGLRPRLEFSWPLPARVRTEWFCVMAATPDVLLFRTFEETPEFVAVRRATGTPLWENTGMELFGGDQHGFTFESARELRARRAEDGATLWTHEGLGLPWLTPLGPSRLAVRHRELTRFLDRATGAVIATMPIIGGRGALLCRDAVYMDADGRGGALVAVTLEGHELWRVAASHSDVHALAASDHRVYVLDVEGRLSAFGTGRSCLPPTTDP